MLEAKEQSLLKREKRNASRHRKCDYRGWPLCSVAPLPMLLLTTHLRVADASLPLLRTHKTSL